MSGVGPQPGDDQHAETISAGKVLASADTTTVDDASNLTPRQLARREGISPEARAATDRLPRWLQRLLGSPVQPAIITDRSGESRPGVWVRWRK